MKFIIMFVVSFLVVYLAYLFTVILNKKKLKKFETSNQALYFNKKYNVKVSDKNVKLLANLVAISNAFIISTTLIIIDLVPNYILKVLVAFVIIIPLILVLYHIVGLVMLKRGNK